MRIFNENFEAARALTSAKPINLLEFGFSTPVKLSDRDIMVPTGDDLITNGDMELDSDWSFWPVLSTDHVHAGQYSRILSGQAGDSVASAAFTSESAVDYHHSVWFYSTAATSVTVQIRNGADTGYLHNAAHAIAAGIWTEVAVDYNDTAPGSAGFVRYLLTEAATVYIDAASINYIPASPAELLFDGDMELEEPEFFVINWPSRGTAVVTNEQSEEQVYSGVTSRKLVVEDDAEFPNTGQDDYCGFSNGDNVWNGPHYFTTVTGASYRLSLRVYSPAHTDIFVGLTNGAGDPEFLVAQTFQISTGEWNEIVINFSETKGGAAGELCIGAGNSPNLTNRIYYFDKFSLKATVANLLDGSMETTAGWTTTVADEPVCSRSSDQAHAGTYSWKISGIMPGKGIAGEVFTTTEVGPFDKLPVKKYRVSAWVYTADATAIRVIARNGLDTAASYNQIHSLTAEVWQQITFDFTEFRPGFLSKICFVGADDAAGETVYLDDVSGFLLTVGYQGLVSGWGFLDSAASQVSGKSLLGTFENSDLSLAIINCPPNQTLPGDVFHKNSTSSDPIEGVEVRLLQWFAGLALDDAEPLFIGKVGGQPDYDQTEYRLTIEGAWKKYNVMIGADTVVSETDYPYCSPDDVGKMENFIFGTVRNVPLLKVRGYGVTLLSADIDDNDTTIAVENAAKLPSSGTLVCEYEQINYTGKSGDSVTGCTRGYSGTTAAAHAAGVAVFPLVTDYIYQVAGIECYDCYDVRVGKWRIHGHFGVSDAFYLDGGKTYYRIPRLITRTYAANVLEHNGLTHSAALAAVATIPGGTNDVSLSDTLSLLEGGVFTDTPTTITTGAQVSRLNPSGLIGNCAADVDVGPEIWADIRGINATNPATLYEYILLNFCGLTAVDATSFSAAEDFYTSNNYHFNLLIKEQILASDLFSKLDIQCRSRFIFTHIEEAKLLVRQLGQSSGHNVSDDEILEDSISLRRSADADIINSFKIHSDRDWSQTAGGAWQKVTPFDDSTSQGIYGICTPGNPEQFHFDAVSDSAAMVAHVGAFWLDFLKNSRVIISFSVCLDNCEIEPGDIINVIYVPFLANHSPTLGPYEVIKTRWQPGSLKNNSIDRLEILAVDI